MVVRPVALAAPASVSGNGGPVSYNVTFGYNGPFSATARGLVAADITAGSVADDPTDGQPAEIACGPVVKAQAEASLTYGSYVSGDTTGRLKATTTANDDVFGITLEASSTAGDIIRVLVSRFNY